MLVVVAVGNPPGIAELMHLHPAVVDKVLVDFGTEEQVLGVVVVLVLPRRGGARTRREHGEGGEEAGEAAAGGTGA